MTSCCTSVRCVTVTWYRLRRIAEQVVLTNFELDLSRLLRTKLGVVHLVLREDSQETSQCLKLAKKGITNSMSSPSITIPT